MHIVGIVAEYNPFHSGHAHHIAATRAAVGEDSAILCVMSGNWVQRGEAAIADKWTRAGQALRGGADLVVELPTLWAASSAEAFARGAVDLLAAAGARTLSFGSEAGRVGELAALAECLDGAAYRQALRQALDQGRSFAAARQQAAAACVGSGAELLAQANNSLGVEYLRALRRGGHSMDVVTVPRRGAGHHEAFARGGTRSASALRSLMRAGDWDEAQAYLPPGGAARLRAAGTYDLTRCERGVLARLKTMEEADFLTLPDCGPELAARLAGAARQGRSLEEVYALAKTRRYAHARIRRLVLWSFLGLRAADRPVRPPYVRVLGLNGRGRQMLRQMREACPLPVLTKAAHVKRQAPEARRLFTLESRCTDLYGLCGDTIIPGGREYTAGPVVEA
ncbi:MAG: nucleotidyltransferase family protein [Clostridiales bacterium]|nr:nucleotidyltransferase family protein [Clostridiales bacterium]